MNRVYQFTKLVIGLVILGLGISFLLNANLGVDPASVFISGIAHQLNSTYGIAAMVFNAITLTICYFIKKEYVSIGSIVAAFLVGYSVDIILPIVIQLNLMQSFITQLIFTFIGIAIMAFGVALYIDADLGVGAADIIAEIIHERTKIEYRWVRITSDIVFCVIGYFLGGNFGLVGTISAVFLLGPLIQVSKKLIQ